MWLFVMFDLPVKEKLDRKAAAQFRKSLEHDGFTMHQFSVYTRFCASLEAAQVHIRRIQSLLPEKGKVSILMVTDKQYANIQNFWGAVEKKAANSTTTRLFLITLRHKTTSHLPLPVLYNESNLLDFIHLYDIGCGLM